MTWVVLVGWPQLLLKMTYFLQSVQLTAARCIEAACDAVVEPMVPAVVPHAAAPPGASDLLVPGANPTTVKSKGASSATVPGTRKTTASIELVVLSKVAPGPLVPVPVVPAFQHCVVKLLKGAKLGP